MGNEAAWSATVHSDSRLNKMTNIPNTGAVLAGLDKTKHGILICTSSGSGLIKDHVYLCNADGDSLIDLSGIAVHVHSDSTGGGSLIDIFDANRRFTVLQLLKTTDLVKESWDVTTTTGGTVENSTPPGARYIRLRPNATSGSGATITYPCLNHDWNLDLIYEAKLQIETATSIALHSGVGANLITAADSNIQKVQAEVCTVTNNNWWLRTASGSANSASDTGIAIVGGSNIGVRIEHHPTLGTPETDLIIEGASTLQKTSNIPVSGQTSSDNIIRHSVKNSTGADRPLRMYGCRLTYQIAGSGEQWVV